MRVGILLSNQTPSDTPQHYVSRKLSPKFLAYYHDGKRACRQLGDTLIQIVVPLTFGKLKALVKQPERFVMASGKQFVPANYIPAKMPPIEVEGCTFRPPESFVQQMPHFIHV
jgi:hypothetical protein